MNVNLVMLKKNGTQKSFSVPSSVTVIGRRGDCDLCIPLMVVSRRHCELNQDQGQLRIRDLGSRNGTFLNGNKIGEAQLSPGDNIQVGPLSFAVQIDGQPEKLTGTDNGTQILTPPEGVAESQDRNEQIIGLEDLEVGRDHHATEAFNEIPDDISEQADINN